MKKLFLSLVIVLISVTAMYSQSSVLATLSHEGEISTYYGATALKEAHAAAQHGDVITLSSGSFQAVNLTKAVTIRGAGMQTDTIAKIYPSVVVGSFSINVADSLEQHLTLEGIYCDNSTVAVYNMLKNATFLKTRFYNFVSSVNVQPYGYMINVAFIHCKIANCFDNYNGGNSLSFVNCVIYNPRVGRSSFTNNSFEFTNCVVRWNNSNYSPDVSYYALFRNCILTSSLTSYNSISTTNMIYNCLGIASTNMFSKFGSLNNNMYYTGTSLTNVFKTWTGSYSDTENFELKDEAKTEYPGDDGKEIGIHGGNLPFTPNPTNPKITKFNVASKSTADGKLSVDIEVKAAE